MIAVKSLETVKYSLFSSINPVLLLPKRVTYMLETFTHNQAFSNLWQNLNKGMRLV